MLKRVLPGVTIRLTIYIMEDASSSHRNSLSIYWVKTAYILIFARPCISGRLWRWNALIYVDNIEI